MLYDILTIIAVCFVIAALEFIFNRKKSKLNLSSVGLIAILLPPAFALHHSVDAWFLFLFSLIGVVLLMKESRI